MIPRGQRMFKCRLLLIRRLLFGIDGKKGGGEMREIQRV